MGLYYNDNGTLKLIAGRGKAEYGASTIRKGEIAVPAISSTEHWKDQTITFSTPMPDTDYQVSLTIKGSNTHRVAFQVIESSKTVNGFTVRYTPVLVKDTITVGVDGIATNEGYTLVGHRNSTSPNLFDNWGILYGNYSIPSADWNIIKSEYLRFAMPANNATLCYTAFKLYTDKEYAQNAFTPTITRNTTYTSDLTEHFGVRNGNVCQIHFNFRLVSIPVATSVIIGTYTPKNSVPYSEVCLDYGLFLGNYMRVWFDSNGNIYAHSGVALNNHECRGSVTYICQ